MTDDFPFKTKPMKHQLEIWEKSRDRPYYALFLQMGTGKSKVICDTAAWLYLEGKIDTLLLTAKKGEYTVWLDQLKDHMPIDYTVARYRAALREPEKQAIRELVKPNGKLRVLLINIESLANINDEPGVGNKVARAFIKSKTKGCMFVIDESTSIKSRKSQRTKDALKIARLCEYRRILTGTPITQGPLDLYSQCQALDPYALGQKSWTAFKNEYAVEERKTFGSRSFMSIKEYRNLDQLQKQLKRFSTILTREECLDLPEKIYIKHPVDLTPEQERIYKQMREEAIAELGSGEVVSAVNALGVVSRLDQIACGQLVLKDGTYEIIKNNREEAVLDRLENFADKAIVWCNYRGLLDHYFKAIKKRFGDDSVARYYGDVHDDERIAAIRNFKDKNSPVRWILGNQVSLGYGQTLVEGKANFYISNGYHLEHRLQSEDRTMRIGQEKNVLYCDFYAPNTVNMKILQALRAKKSLADLVLGTRIQDWI